MTLFRQICFSVLGIYCFVIAVILLVENKLSMQFGFSELVTNLLIVVLLLAGAGIMAAVVYGLMKPIKAIYEQSHAILDKDLLQIKKLPVAEDLQVIVKALNTTAVTIKRSFYEHVDIVNIVREQAYKDNLTGLPNRKFFAVQLEYMLNSTNLSIEGVLFLVRVDNLHKYRNKFGKQVVDSLIKNIATLLQEFDKHYKVALFANLGECGLQQQTALENVREIFRGEDPDGFENNTFAMLILDANANNLNAMCTNIFIGIDKLLGFDQQGELPFCNIGVTTFSGNSYSKDVVLKACKAVEEAKNKDRNTWYFIPVSHKTTMLTAVDWGKLLHGALQDRNIVLKDHPVFFYEQDGTILFHTEVLMHMRNVNRELLASSVISPVIASMNLGVEFDQLVIEKTIERIQDNPDSSQRFGINIYGQSLDSPRFARWLKRQCANKLAATRLTFEFSESFVHANLAGAKRIIKILRDCGIQIGLDSFGRGFSSFAYLDQLKIDYIKIDGSYIRGIDNDLDSQMVVRSIIEIAHGLDILVFATNVERRAEQKILSELRVDGAQGYLLGQAI